MIETVIQIIFVPLADDLLAPMMNISRIGFMVCWIGYTRIMFESITLIIISLIMIKIIIKLHGNYDEYLTSSIEVLRLILDNSLILAIAALVLYVFWLP